MRSILVYAANHDYVNGGKALSARLETALALARMTSGHVTVMVNTAIAHYDPITTMGIDPMSSSFMATDAIGGGGFVGAEAIVASMARDDAFANSIEARLAREDVAYDVIRGSAEPVDALADAARLADVVVLSRDCDFAGALALSTRCPILLVPSGSEDSDGAATSDQAAAGVPASKGGTLMPIERACIAWDGGEEAAAALRAAVPLLTGEVYVLTVNEGQGDFQSTEALRYLSRHGIKAEFVEVERVGSAEQSLAAMVASLKGDLLVMGAYGRSRVSEYLFGGITQHFLSTEAGPALFLAH